MNLKSATLLAAITQTLAALFSAFNFAVNLTRSHALDNWSYLLTAPFSLLAQVAMAVFLFTFFERQKWE